MQKAFTAAVLIQKFSESLGVEKATVLITEALQQTGLAAKETFNKEDILTIVKLLKQQGGFVAIIASCLGAEAYRYSIETANLDPKSAGKEISS
jgi:uncharacterized membrane protein YoaK (UPF0700 family)